VGINVPMGDRSSDYSAGHSAGVLLGVHTGFPISFNGEFNVEFLNPSETMTDYMFSPLVHLGSPRREIVFGPKVGAYRYSLRKENGSSEPDHYTASGFAIGFNFGAFVPLGPMAIGGLVSYTLRDSSEVCSKSSYSSENTCTDYGHDFPPGATFDLSIALLF
jgi:hypothetical protein